VRPYVLGNSRYLLFAVIEAMKQLLGLAHCAEGLRKLPGPLDYSLQTFPVRIQSLLKKHNSLIWLWKIRFAGYNGARKTRPPR
jgi:hypothetical protein